MYEYYAQRRKLCKILGGGGGVTKMLCYLMYEYYAQQQKLFKILGGGSAEGTGFLGRYGGMLPQNCNYERN